MSCKAIVRLVRIVMVRISVSSWLSLRVFSWSNSSSKPFEKIVTNSFRVVQEVDVTTGSANFLEVDPASGSTYLQAYVSIVLLCQSRPVIQRRLNSLSPSSACNSWSCEDEFFFCWNLGFEPLTLKSVSQQKATALKSRVVFVVIGKVAATFSF